MTRSLLAASLVSLASLASLLLSGCGGGASAGVESPSVATPSADISSPEGALAAVDSAEHAIDRMLGPAVSATIAQSAGQAIAPAAPPPPPSLSPAQPAPPPPPPPASRSGGAMKKGPERDEAVRQETAGGDACGALCSALASMERAADHLCNITGSADGRCASVRDRVKRASARVHATCPVCGG